MQIRIWACDWPSHPLSVAPLAHWLGASPGLIILSLPCFHPGLPVGAGPPTPQCPALFEFGEMS